MPPLRGLTRRLLVDRSPARRRRTGGRVLSARIERLLAMGDLDTAKRLLDQLPPAAADSPLARRRRRGGAAAGDDPPACQRADDPGADRRRRVLGRDRDLLPPGRRTRRGARLGLDLLREAGQTDDAAFFELAGALADGGRRPPPPPLSPNRRRSTSRCCASPGWPLPERALADAAPPRAGRGRARAGARRRPPAGDRRAGVLVRRDSAAELAASYAERPAAGDALPSARSDWVRRRRRHGLRRRASKRPTGGRGRAAGCGLAGSRAAPSAFWSPRCSRSRSPSCRSSGSLLAVAPSAARALLAADRPLPAARWFVSADARESGATAAARRGRRWCRCSRWPGSAAAMRCRGWTRRRSRPGGRPLPPTPPRPSACSRCSMGSARRCPIRPAGGIAAAPLERQASVPASALWRGLERAAAERRRRRDRAARAAHAERRAAAAHPEVLTACLRALRAVGLDQEARAIAVATALEHGPLKRGRHAGRALGRKPSSR